MTPRGMFRHQFAVQNYATSVDSYGQGTKTWTTAATVLGHIETANPSQLETVDVARGEITYRIVLPWVAGVTTASRLLLQETGQAARTLEVLGVADLDLRRMELEIEAREVIG
jgi:head-tail adaptor